MSGERVTFSFGANWKKFNADMHPEAVDRTKAYIRDWIGNELEGSAIIDIGSGSGLTSLAAWDLGASVTSFDVDPASVEATKELHRRAGQPGNWRVLEGSILDSGFAANLGQFDVVISWGVLHHTGRLWDAVDAAAGLVAPEGRLWLALYHRTPQSRRSLRTKRLYNRMPQPAKTLFRTAYGAAKVLKNLVVRRSLKRLTEYHRERGMDWRRDVEDWLGGLPYEVSSPGELLSRLRPMGFTLERLHDGIGEGSTDVYLFRMRREPTDSPTVD